jgi:hypothetical protein
VIDTPEAIAKLIEGTCLEGSKILQLQIPESSHSAFALSVKPEAGIAAWNLMRSHLEQTQRYPLLVLSWVGNSKNWEQEVIENDFFSRFYYQEERFQGKKQDIAPAAILSRVPLADLEDFLERKASLFIENLNNEIDLALAITRERFGTSPERSQIEELTSNNSIKSRVDLEKWLFNWELENFNQEAAIVAPDTRYLEWYEPRGQNLILLLLPTTNGWDSLAYIHWYGACSASSEIAISFLKRWQQRYQAELVCHYGTMLQLNVGRLPATPQEAFALAWEQEAIAECTTILPGISLRDHARALLTVNRWFLHERP